MYRSDTGAHYARARENRLGYAFPEKTQQRRSMAAMVPIRGGSTARTGRGHSIVQRCCTKGFPAGAEDT